MTTDEWETEYREWGAYLTGYASRRVDWATAQDIVNDVFLAVWKRRDQLTPLPRHYYLLAIRHRIINSWARRPTTEVPETASVPFPAREEFWDAQAALKRLPRSYKLALARSGWGYPAANDAEKVRRFRARAALRRAL